MHSYQQVSEIRQSVGYLDILGNMQAMAELDWNCSGMNLKSTATSTRGSG
jgi:hypothetical protein